MVSHILQTLSSIKTLTRAAEDALQIRFMMVGITGDWPRFPRPYEFPEELQNKAAAILTKLEEDLVVEEVIEDSPPPQASNALRDTSIKRAGKSPTSPFSPARQFPNVNDPTYNKYMHDIQISEGRRRSYIIGDKSKIISSEVFGHNGLSVGDWFPYRICALRDGAHGHMMGGIAGSKDVGAFSVVVSGTSSSRACRNDESLTLPIGGYAELDEDLGDVLYYSGSDSHKNVDPVNTILTHATKALRTSFNQKRPVRVLRGGGKARHCPSKGFRYDGLYYIVAEEVSKNKKGGAYMRFKMVRDAGQPEIDEHRPTQAERAFLTGSSLAFDDR